MGYLYALNCPLFRGWNSGRGNDGIDKKELALDTGEGFNLSSRSDLQVGWEKNIDMSAAPLKLKDGNCQRLAIRKIAWMALQFGNYLYKVSFIVVEQLTIEVLIGTSILNHHLMVILWKEGKVRFRKGEVTILKQNNGGSQTDFKPFLSSI